jgi:hypothetical protein
MRTSLVTMPFTVTSLIPQNVSALAIFHQGGAIVFLRFQAVIRDIRFLDSPKPGQYGPRGFLGRRGLRVS